MVFSLDSKIASRQNSEKGKPTHGITDSSKVN